MPSSSITTCRGGMQRHIYQSLSWHPSYWFGILKIINSSQTFYALHITYRITMMTPKQIETPRSILTTSFDHFGTVPVHVTDKALPLIIILLQFLSIFLWLCGVVCLISTNWTEFSVEDTENNDPLYRELNNRFKKNSALLYGFLFANYPKWCPNHKVAPGTYMNCYFKAHTCKQIHNYT